MRYTREAVKGSTVSITILRYQQDSKVKLSLK